MSEHKPHGVNLTACIHCRERLRHNGSLWCAQCILSKKRWSGNAPRGEPVDRSWRSRHQYRKFDRRACPCHRPAMNYREPS